MTQHSYLPDIHRLLPQASDAERGLLSSLFLAPLEIGAMCAEKAVRAEWMHLPAHAQIFTVSMELWEKNQPFDFITITQLFRDRGQLDQVGGGAYITELFTFPTAANALSYIEILQEKFTLREIIKVCTEYAARSYDEQDDVPALLAGVEAKIMAIGQRKTSSKRPFSQILMEAIESIEKGEDATADTFSGLDELDRIVRMRRGNFIVISGEAKSGKTALAGTIATNAARNEQRVVIVSLEMNDVEMVKRMIANAGRVNVSLIGRQPSEYDIQGVTRGAKALQHADVEIISDTFDLGGIVARLRQLHARKPLDLVVLDYIQLVEHSTGRKGETRQEIVAQISRTCKRVAGELNCVLVGLSQLNEEGKLRESRAIGQDANAIIAVEKDDKGGRAIRVVAQRNGESNVTADVQWLPQFTKFENK